MSAVQHSEDLSEIADLNPSLAELLSSDSPVSFVPMSAVTAETASTTNGEDRRYCDVSKGYTPFLNGDLLVAKITPCFENGKIAQATLTHRIGFGSTEFHVVRPKPGKADARYLLHFLRQGRIRRDGERKMTGSAGQRRVPEHFLAGLQVPLPSLPEQRRIAEVLDRTDALRAKRREALAHLDTLAQAIFIDMFGDPVANLKGWATVPLGEHTTKIGSGATPRGGESAYQSAGVALIRSMNVRDGKFLYDGLAYLDDEKARRLDNVTVEPSDVLLNITGASVARVCLVPSAVLPARVNQHVAIIRPTESFHPVFLENLLLCDSMKNRLLRVAGAGATREAITKAEIERLDIILPPRQLQGEFAALLDVVGRSRSLQEAALCDLDSLFASVQFHAFRGDL